MSLKMGSLLFDKDKISISSTAIGKLKQYRKRFLILGIGIILCATSLQFLSIDFSKTWLSVDSHLPDDDIKLIVAWTRFFGRPIVPSIEEALAQCPVKCVISGNRTLAPLAHAVVFHIDDTEASDVSTARFPHQRYVFYNMEAPTRPQPALQCLSKNFFNWTMTYRLDSDIHNDYGNLQPKNTTSPSAKRFVYSWDYVRNVTSGKTKLVLQFVSRCASSSRREKYVEELAKSISIDIYGGCSNKKCPRFEAKCDNMITNDYRFYLAFENSVCLDYVTEKFWTNIKQLIVPVVLRNSDYINTAPKGSYIAADQFESPKELAAYLNFLANNQTEYLKYFEWTKYYWYSKDYWSSFCDLCHKLHYDKGEHKVYDNLVKWWSQGGNCQGNFAQNLLLKVNSKTTSTTTHSISTKSITKA